MTKVYNITKLKDRRRNLRRDSTETEKILWWHLRGNRVGVKFRRQYSISGYIVDFYCAEKRLIVEIDGEIHEKAENKLNDKIREKLLKELDYKILRFTNKEIKDNLDEVLNKIKENL